MSIVLEKAPGVIAIAATTSFQLFPSPNVTISFKASANPAGTLAPVDQLSYKVFWASLVSAATKSLDNTRVAASSLLWYEAEFVIVTPIFLVFPKSPDLNVNKLSVPLLAIYVSFNSIVIVTGGISAPVAGKGVAGVMLTPLKAVSQVIPPSNVTISFKAVINASGILLAADQLSYKVFWASIVVSIANKSFNTLVAAIFLSLESALSFRASSIFSKLIPRNTMFWD